MQSFALWTPSATSELGKSFQRIELSDEPTWRGLNKKIKEVASWNHLGSLAYHELHTFHFIRDCKEIGRHSTGLPLVYLAGFFPYLSSTRISAPQSYLKKNISLNLSSSNKANKSELKSSAILRWYYLWRIHLPRAWLRALYAWISYQSDPVSSPRCPLCSLLYFRLRPIWVSITFG